MPILNGIDAGRKIEAELPETAIVILSSNADEHFIEEAKKIGAEGLVIAIERAINDGEFVLVD
jgi:DNA-binding NarL/FixJ family response regulator